MVDKIIRKIKINREDGLKKKSDGKCLFPVDRKYALLSKGIIDAGNMINDITGSRISIKTEYSEIPQKDGKRIGRLTVISNEGEKETILSKIPISTEELEKSINECIIDEKTKGIMYCEGFNHGIDILSEQLPDKGINLKKGCKLDKKFVGDEELWKIHVGLKKI